MEQHAYSHSPIADLDEQILLLMEAGLPICERPYREIAKSLALGEMALILRLQKLIRERRSLRLIASPSVDAFECTTTMEGASSELILSHWDAELLTLINYGLPLSSRPYHILAKVIGVTVDEIICRTQRLKDWGLVGKIRPIR